MPPNGFSPSFMRGAWDKRDRLELEVDVYMREGQAAVSNTADPNTGRPGRVSATRGDTAAFRALCSQLGRPAAR